MSARFKHIMARSLLLETNLSEFNKTSTDKQFTFTRTPTSAGFRVNGSKPLIKSSTEKLQLAAANHSIRFHPTLFCPMFKRNKCQLILIINLLGYLKVMTPVSAQSDSPRVPTDLFRYWSKPVSAAQKNPLSTGLVIQARDFVYVEVHGEIKVGNYLGNANGIGLINAPLLSLPSRYTKYDGLELGALVVGIGSQNVACTQLFRSTGHPIYNALVDKDRMVTDQGSRNYVPGVYFIASSDGTLTLDINDSIVTDNEGEYRVEVFVVRQSDHAQRNRFNVCPASEPDEDVGCGKRDGWKKESVLSAYYHGMTNNSYRGSDRFAGCQCVYDLGGKLLTSGEYIGSFDVGFWIGKSNDSNSAAKHRHLILDVLPHDLYESNLGTNNYVGQKTYECK